MPKPGSERSSDRLLQAILDLKSDIKDVRGEISSLKDGLDLLTYVVVAIGVIVILDMPDVKDVIGKLLAF